MAAPEKDDVPWATAVGTDCVWFELQRGHVVWSIDEATTYLRGKLRGMGKPMDWLRARLRIFRAVA